MAGKIGVLGGGISGLTFANLVKNSEVLEKEQTFGGLMRSVKFDEYTFDQGSHIIFSSNTEVLNFMVGLLGHNFIKHRRNTAIFYKGKPVKYPFENGLADLPRTEAIECGEDYAAAYEKRENGELEAPKNFKEWMLYRFGKAITDKYLYPYNRKVWDYPPEKMDIFWVEGRVPQPPLEDVMKAARGEASEGYTHQLNFYYPARGGIQALTDSLAERIPEARRAAGFEVKRIRKEGGKWFVKDGRDPEREYAQLVNTLHPLDFLAAYEGVPKEVKDAAAALKWNSVYLVMLGIAKKKISDLHWAYIPDSGILPNRISFPSNMSPKTAPSKHSSVLAEITFGPDGEKAKLKEKEIIERTVDDLHGMKIIDRNDVACAKLATAKYAYVVYDLDYRKNMQVIEAFANREGITLLGRWGEFGYYNSDRCVEHAMTMAKNFL